MISLNIEVDQVIDINPSGRKLCDCLIARIMLVDDLVMQGSRLSTSISIDLVLSDYSGFSTKSGVTQIVPVN